MFLPPFYRDCPDEYLRDVTKCLQENCWIFNFQITKFFGNRTWEKVPTEWREPLLNLSTEELNELPYNFYKEDWPESLKSFLRLAHRLSIPCTRSEKYSSIEIDKGIKRGMIPKKIAEVSSLAVVVDAVCREARCKGIIDVGAGLGYLGQVLSLQLGHHVVGLELRDNHTKGAELRQTKHGSNSKSTLYTLELKDDVESRENLREILQLESRNSTVTKSAKTGASLSTVCASSMLTSDFRNSETVCDENNLDENILAKQDCGCDCATASVVGVYDAKMSQKRTAVRPEKSEKHPAPNMFDANASGGLKCDLCDYKKSLSMSGQKYSCETTATVTENIGKKDATADGSKKDATADGSKKDATADGSKKDATADGSKKDATADGSKKDTAKLLNISQNNSRDIDPGFCMIGLHCCGDLTPTMLKMFGDIKELTCLVCVSCCYHNMERTDGVFRNFPMSGRVRDRVGGRDGGAETWCSHYAFRLAAQETRARWKNQSKTDHEQHTRHVAYRGILQEFIEKGNNKLKKIKRKVARKSAFDDFGSYLGAVLDRTEGVDICSQRQDLLDLYAKYEAKFKYIEPITALQVVLQPVLESLITIDRVLYLKERGIPAHILPLFDGFISPRNLAIIAKKS